ncbi:MAG: protein GlmU [Desulfamplus sp.]|nr:protein GlmU [Desulfamplus sp.]
MDKINLLINKGVKILNPESIFIDDDVDVERISGDNVTLYPFTKLMGKETLIMSDTTLGFEGAVTLDNVLVGKGTRLNGGFFQKCVFAGNNSFGSGAHVREGTILEEGASAAHTVGLKQTILFPFVTLGSLINFCDCLMAGGTSRKDHSEVGSSFIHFNYTPNQDKATPSMFGNVYQGVMIKSHPIFLGGQGGVVGPCRMPFGSVTAAGTIWRKDILEPDKLMFGGGIRESVLDRKIGIYSNVKRIFKNNILYIAGLISLMSWYVHIRPIFVGGTNLLSDSNSSADDSSSLSKKVLQERLLSKQLLLGMQKTLKSAIDERIKRLDDFVKRLHKSKETILSGNDGKITPLVKEHDDIINMWDRGINYFKNSFDQYFFVRSFKQSSSASCSFELSEQKPPKGFIRAIEDGIKENGNDYIRVIQSLDRSASDIGSGWLESIENRIYSEFINI